MWRPFRFCAQQDPKQGSPAESIVCTYLHIPRSRWPAHVPKQVLDLSGRVQQQRGMKGKLLHKREKCATLEFEAVNG